VLFTDPLKKVFRRFETEDVGVVLDALVE
jgi:glutaredoxin-related protein